MGFGISRPVMVVFIIGLLLGGSVFAQAPDFSWARFYGGLYDELGLCIEQTSDDGYILAGASYNFDMPDASFIRINSVGDTLWTKFYRSDNWDQCFSIKQTADGGFIAAIWGVVNLMKLDANGDSIWTKSYGGASTHVELTSDGGYILSSELSGCFGLTKTDSLGNLIWQHNYSYGLSSGPALSVKQLADGGFIAVGVNATPGQEGSDCYVIRVDPEGDTVWTRLFSNPNLIHAEGNDVCQAADGGFIILLKDFSVIKTDANGDQQWFRFCGGNDGENAVSLSPLTDGTYLLGGTGSDYYSGFFMARINIAGDTLWTVREGQSFCWGLGARPTRDGGYIMGTVLDLNGKIRILRLSNFQPRQKLMMTNRCIPIKYRFCKMSPIHLMPRPSSNMI